MAEKKIAVDLVIDSGDSLKELKLVEDELKSIEDTIRQVNASDDKGLENQLKSLNKVVEDNNLTWSELGKTIEQYQNIALASGKESPIGQEALKRAGALKSEMDNLTRSVDSLATNGSNLNTALQISGGVVAGYTAVQSITALIGDENEELMEVMIKLQATQGVLASIEQVRFALEKDSLVVLKAKNLWTKAQVVATNLLAGATKKEALATVTASTATKGFTKALAGTGIGLIVVALGLLIANFDKVKNVVTNVNDFIMSLTGSFKEMSVIGKILYASFYPFIFLWQTISGALEYFGVIDDEVTRKQKENNRELISDLQERGKEIDELIAKQQQMTDNAVKQLDREIALRKAHGKDVQELEREKLSIIEASALKEFELAKQRLKLFAQEIILKLRNNELTREQYEEQVNQFNELAKQLNDTKQAYLDASNNIQVYEANITTTLRNESVKRQEIRNKEFLAWQEELDNKIQAYREHQENLAIEREIWEDAEAPLPTIEEETPEQDLTDFEALEKRKFDIKKLYSDKSLNESIRVGNLLNDLNSAFLDADLKKAGNNEAKKERIRKASFERVKKISLSLAFIDGAKAITSILAQYPKFDGGIAMSGALASAITTTGIQIAKIKSTQYQSSGSIGSVTGSIASGFSNTSSNNTQYTNSQPLTTTDITQLINQTTQNNSILVVDDVNKVNEQQNKIALASSI